MGGRMIQNGHNKQFHFILIFLNYTNFTKLLKFQQITHYNTMIYNHSRNSHTFVLNIRQKNKLLFALGCILQRKKNGVQNIYQYIYMYFFLEKKNLK